MQRLHRRKGSPQRHAVDHQALTESVEELFGGGAVEPCAHRPDVEGDDASAERIVESAKLRRCLRRFDGHGQTSSLDERRILDNQLPDVAPTYMANALACAAANASLDLFESEPRLEQGAAISAALARDLAPCRDLSGVRDVRVKGAIGLVELERIDDLDALRRRFVAAGVWVRPFGRIVYLTPAFTIGEDDLRRLTAAVLQVLTQWTRERR